ncbi:tRNA lysidine(34) synthetase TilS [Fimbriimonas ginsengisoli]|uniref:tRNA(Ile)-lysidine synthase n=1 Tax=Fimbriimonas ginsengisoli Gsoil 348 TaxID=661478 RepID=A0A068NJ33_FIMGI|nr:tRNA lysidine(34) synthetase TilS [Fimbriimonas ginsengisoli]AIE83593.1 tRNA(Ile)-lysidine synthetase [Fimbriimonas ginsengisoli Gsoil 348]
MLDRFRRHLGASGLIPEGARVLVGYSGGADSTCLLHMLRVAGVDVVAAHLHHGQREEADTEMRLCEAFAESLDIPFVSGRADVPRMSQELGMGLEEAGREARYGFFRQAAYQLDCQLIATAHTRNDHVETMLLNLTRGTGLTGLGGIPERREEIVRPILIFSREQTRAYCEENGFWFHDDPANSDLSFSRARIRHRVLPELRSINPAADSALMRLASLVQEEDRFLSGMAAAALEQSEISVNGELKFLTEDVEVYFDRGRLSGLPPVLFRRAIRLAVEALEASLDHEQTSILLSGIASQERGSVTADGGEVVVEWTPELVGARRLQPTQPFRYALTIPGETMSDEFGWQFTAFEEAYDQVSPARAELSTRIDRRKTKGTLYFRTAGSGDTMRPLGFSGQRKLSDLLSESGLTPAARSRLPIVCDLVGPIWAPGVCLDERVRPEASTDLVLTVRFARISPNDR